MLIKYCKFFNKKNVCVHFLLKKKLFHSIPASFIVMLNNLIFTQSTFTSNDEKKSFHNLFGILQGLKASKKRSSILYSFFKMPRLLIQSISSEYRPRNKNNNFALNRFRDGKYSIVP